MYIYSIVNNKIPENGLKIWDNRVFSSLKSEDKLFFSFVQNGLFEYDGENLNEIRFDEKSIDNGHLVNQNDSTFWLLNANASFEVVQKSTHEYDVSRFKPTGIELLKEIKGNQYKFFFVLPNGSVGQSEFNTLKGEQVTTPKIVIENITTFDSAFSEVPACTIELEYQNRKLTVDFVVLNFQNRVTEYQYKLEGVDTNWVSTQSNSIVFTSLAPEQYVLVIRSRFAGGQWINTNPIKFTVLKPFWQALWFTSLCLVSALVFIYLLLKFRFDRKVKSQKQEYNALKLEQRALRSQMSPHFIFNIIASLQYLVVEGSRDKAMRFLEMFSKSLRNLLDQSNENAISIQEEIKFLTEYIELEKFRAEDLFDFSINTEPKDIEGKIPTFVIQPFVENAIKHGLKNVTSKSKLEIYFRKVNQFIEVEVTDNGIGRAASNPTKKKKQSHGIRLVKERLRIHNRKAENVIIEDLRDADGQDVGTKVIIQIKLQDKILKENS